MNICQFAKFVILTILSILVIKFQKNNSIWYNVDKCIIYTIHPRDRIPVLRRISAYDIPCGDAFFFLFYAIVKVQTLLSCLLQPFQEIQRTTVLV